MLWQENNGDDKVATWRVLEVFCIENIGRVYVTEGDKIANVTFSDGSLGARGA